MMKQDQIRGWNFKLYNLYDEINSAKNLGLRRPQIAVSSLSADLLGSWDKQKRLISISLDVLEKGTYKQLLHVLKHEMAHQFVDEVLQRKDNKPHGDLFKLACQSIGVSAEATFKVDVQKDRRLEKIEKLLALATSMNQFEAESALAKAQELSFKYNVEYSTSSDHEYMVRPIGEIRKRIPAYEWKIMNILSEFYFVQTLKTYHQEESHLPHLWQFEIYGTSHNIDTAEYVYYFLRNNAVELWQVFRKKNGQRVSRMRNSFINGLIDGFSEKLEKEQRALKNKYDLVKVHDSGLLDFFHECNPRISRRKVAFSAGAEVYSAGLDEGRKLKVNPGIKSRKAGREGLLLTDKSVK